MEREKKKTTTQNREGKKRKKRERWMELQSPSTEDKLLALPLEVE